MSATTFQHATWLGPATAPRHLDTEAIGLLSLFEQRLEKIASISHHDQPAELDRFMAELLAQLDEMLRHTTPQAGELWSSGEVHQLHQLRRQIDDRLAHRVWDWFTGVHTQPALGPIPGWNQLGALYAGVALRGMQRISHSLDPASRTRWRSCCEALLQQVDVHWKRANA